MAAIVITIALAVTPCAGSDDATATATTPARVLYEQYCAGCHGPSGGGDGPDAVFFEPRPTNLTAGLLKRYTTPDLARRVRTGAPLTLALDPEALRRHAHEVEAIVTYLQRLPALDWESIEPGWGLYVDRCETCHGPAGKPTVAVGRPQQPRDLGDPEWQRSTDDDALVDAVRHGRKGMPALTPRVSVDQGKQIAKFVRLFSPGFALYSQLCVNCHADDGRGMHSLGNVIGEEIALPTVIFDKEYFARRSPEQIRLSVWHMLSAHKPQMPHFRYVLTQEQLESIINYLRKSPGAAPTPSNARPG